MRVLIAPDGFGGTLSGAQAAQAMARGWRAAAPDDELVLAPLSDGGPGLLDVLAAALPDAVRHPLVVEDPLARPVEAAVLLDGTTAYVEAASACGLHLLADAERDPRVTTTYGVGQLVAHAASLGARTVVVGLGGSGTNDGGAGMLAALGVQRLDATGDRVPPGGAALRQVARLEGRPVLEGVQLVAATDVDSPLLGLRGASAAFGPQKGATREDVALLDGALTHWADLLEAHLGVAVRDQPGAGAAGGLGAALLALGARREPGIELVQRLVGLAERVEGADLVLTGEGTFDFSSLSGKVVSGVAALAAEHAVPCLVLAGAVRVGRREAGAAGIEATYSLVEAVGVQAALAEPAEELAALAARVARQWSTSRRATMEGS
ncbi:MAG: glycerate kinase [Frankiales bacterium]|jgi:glycerate kinase|nr:glycerate kinase [Frankiales bacterium]